LFEKSCYFIAVYAYGEDQTCVILAQNDKANLVGLILAQADGNKLNRFDICVISSSGIAKRSGEYPIMIKVGQMKLEP